MNDDDVNFNKIKILGKELSKIIYNIENNWENLLKYNIFETLLFIKYSKFIDIVLNDGEKSKKILKTLSNLMLKKSKNMDPLFNFKFKDSITIFH